MVHALSATMLLPEWKEAFHFWFLLLLVTRALCLQLLLPALLITRPEGVPAVAFVVPQQLL
jgi:hypothetical protein